MLAALSVATSIPFHDSELVQTLRLDFPEGETRFVSFLPFKPALWMRTLTEEDFRFLSQATLHWRELDTGVRIRRASRQYGKAIGEPDPMAAFQTAYIGLEALEQPLAIELGRQPGVEVVEGKCEGCGKKYERNRTVLVGVRGFIQGDLHGARTAERENDWRSINRLRHDLFHGLRDQEALRPAAEELLPAIMHYLHDGIAHLVHAHELESGVFELPSPTPSRMVVIGTTTGSPIEELVPLLEAQCLGWTDQAPFGLVPDFSMQTTVGGIEAFPCLMNRPLANATEEDLEPWQWMDIEKSDDRQDAGSSPA